MNDLRRVARVWGLWFLLGFCSFVFGLGGLAWAQGQVGLGYAPDGPNFPTITLNEDQSGAADLPPLREPPPNGFNKQSIWNMRVVGFADDLGCAQSDQIWIENQHGREILYAGSNAGSLVPGVQCGVAIYDVTLPRMPLFLANIAADPAGGGAPHTFVCGGDTLPNNEANGTKGHFYLIIHRGNASTGMGRHEVWDVTNPSTPSLVSTIVGGEDEYHRTWWECDTGIAYLVSGQKSDNWHEQQHLKIFDLSNPAHPLYIRDFGLVGGQPSADISTAQSCINNPGPNCYEGVTNPPAALHEVYSASVNVNRVYLAYSSGSNGVVQIVDRNKLVNGCDTSVNSNASANCAANPTQADMLYPQVGYITKNPLQGAHDTNPIFGVPIPQEQQGFLDGSPQRWDLLITPSEAGGPPSCVGQAPHEATLLDITNDQTPWPISTLNVPQLPGNFCDKGARFGAHHANLQIYAPYYGRLQFVTWFNAGLRVWDIRDPLNPRPVAYFIQAPNGNTQQSCGTPQGPNVCANVTYMDIVEVDDRGYIYGQDRAGSGITILQLTGDALKVVTGQGSQAQ
jgi:hypothetical protein